MKFSLCNEMFEGVSMPDICSTASRLGYHGIEIAPFTLAPSADEITAAQRKRSARRSKIMVLKPSGFTGFSPARTGCT